MTMRPEEEEEEEEGEEEEEDDEGRRNLSFADSTDFMEFCKLKKKKYPQLRKRRQTNNPTLLTSKQILICIKLLC